MVTVGWLLHVDHDSEIISRNNNIQKNILLLIILYKRKEEDNFIKIMITLVRVTIFLT